MTPLQACRFHIVTTSIQYTSEWLHLSSGGKTSPGLAQARASAEYAAAWWTPSCPCQQHPTSPGSSERSCGVNDACIAGPVTFRICRHSHRTCTNSVSRHHILWSHSQRGRVWYKADAPDAFLSFLPYESLDHAKGSYFLHSGQRQYLGFCSRLCRWRGCWRSGSSRRRLEQGP